MSNSNSVPFSPDQKPIQVIENVRTESNAKLPVKRIESFRNILEEHHIPLHFGDGHSSYPQHAEWEVIERDTSSVIGPLGLFGFGWTTFLLNLSNLGVFKMSPVILGTGVAYGGFAQIIAGMFEWHKGNNFTSVAFISYGAFWWSFVLIHSIPVWGWCEPADNQSLAFYLLVWLIFTLVMTAASFTKPWAIRLIFLLWTVLFLLLAIAEWTESKNLQKVAGVIGILCAFAAIYAGTAEIINDAFVKTILPMGIKDEKCFGKITMINKGNES